MFYVHLLFYTIVLKQPFFKSIHFIFIAGGLILNLLLAAIYFYINSGGIVTPADLPGYYTQGWPIVLQTIVIIYFVHYSIQYFNKRYKEEPNNFQRFLREVIFVMLVGFCIMEVFRWIFIRYMVVPEADMSFLEKKLRQIQLIDLTFLILIYAFMTSFRIFQFLQEKQLEVLKWKREYTQSQFETVKNQLNPHFLFNSLSTLASLVYVDADRAESFIQKLSKTYRYLLEQRDKPIVPLQQEYEFVQSYAFLLEQRFGRKVQIEIGPMKSKGLSLPPHTMMILLEYIIHSNAMSAGRPVHIQLQQENDTLVLDYNAQPKATITGNIQEQVAHLEEEYTFLSDRKLYLNNEVGKVIIPLVKTA